MRWRALATDYDGTLADGGRVAPETVRALERLGGTGWRLILVTGRQIEELHRVFQAACVFDTIVAENGALLYWPEVGRGRLLCARASERVVEDLRRIGVAPLVVGRAVIATTVEHEATVRGAIEGLPLSVSRNKDAIMVLPTGVDKGSGIEAALADLRIPAEACVAVGDAENDGPLLLRCGLRIAVANALPELKAVAHRTTREPGGRGVVELIDDLSIGDRRSAR